MRISENTLIMLARSGDEQAVELLRIVENETSKSLLETEFYFQDGPGLFHSSPIESRRATFIGMPAVQA